MNTEVASEIIVKIFMWTMLVLFCVPFFFIIKGVGESIFEILKKKVRK